MTKVTLDDASAPYALVAIRFLAGGLVLLPVALTRRAPPHELRSVALCTVPLLLGYTALTVGLVQTSSTTAAFLSYLLVVIVPVVSVVLFRRLPSAALAVGIVLSVAGLERLTGGAGRFGTGEALCLLAAVLFAFHVLALGHVVTTTSIDALRLSSFQLLGVGLLAAPVGVAVDGPTHPTRFWASALAIGIVGVLALSLQTVGQRDVSPSRTALLLMIDPVVAAGGGYWLGERIGWRGAFGAGLILAGILLTELLTLDRAVNQQET